MSRPAPWPWGDWVRRGGDPDEDTGGVLRLTLDDDDDGSADEAAHRAAWDAIVGDDGRRWDTVELTIPRVTTDVLRRCLPGGDPEATPSRARLVVRFPWDVDVERHTDYVPLHALWPRFARHGLWIDDYRLAMQLLWFCLPVCGDEDPPPAALDVRCRGPPGWGDDPTRLIVHLADCLLALQEGRPTGSGVRFHPTLTLEVPLRDDEAALPVGPGDRDTFADVVRLRLRDTPFHRVLGVSIGVRLRAAMRAWDEGRARLAIVPAAPV